MNGSFYSFWPAALPIGQGMLDFWPVFKPLRLAQGLQIY
jgi:hypothetical protein